VVGDISIDQENSIPLKPLPIKPKDPRITTETAWRKYYPQKLGTGRIQEKRRESFGESLA